MRSHLPVPFIAQAAGSFDCGPVCVQMAMRYFGEDLSLDEIQHSADPDKSGNTWTIGLAKAAAELGCRTEFWTASLGMNPEHFDMEFYRNVTDGPQSSASKIERLAADCRALGVDLHERRIPLKELLSHITADTIAIVLLDWNRIRGKEGYHGHFVVVVGYDGTHVLIHNPGPTDPTPYQAIPYAAFDEARKAKGTDEDVVFISGKRH